jgi:hypothetical protein
MIYVLTPGNWAADPVDSSCKLDYISKLDDAKATRCTAMYEGVSRSFRTGHLQRELHMVQHSATRGSCIAIL